MSATQTEVLDTEDVEIPGLFAAGEFDGGIIYFSYPGGSGLTNGTVFGRVAGKKGSRRLTWSAMAGRSG